MRYYSEPPPVSVRRFGETYICSHPVYSRCTLFKIEKRGLAVIQQRYVERNKHTYWSEIDPWIANCLYLNPQFAALVNERAKEPVDGLFPTITVRQAMWAVKMKPLKKERWETVFDHKDI